MGMTIDDHIEVLKSYSHGFTGCAGNLQNSINVAIDTMRKYQIIQDLYHQAYEEGDQSIFWNELRKVLEYENILPL